MNEFFKVPVPVNEMNPRLIMLLRMAFKIGVKATFTLAYVTRYKPGKEFAFYLRLPTLVFYFNKLISEE